MAAQNGYSNWKGYQLYDTTGTTEDWSYFTTGGFGFTFEIGCNDPSGGYRCRTATSTRPTRTSWTSGRERRRRRRRWAARATRRPTSSRGRGRHGQEPALGARGDGTAPARS